MDYFDGSFLYISRYRMEIFFETAKFKYFLGMPDIPDTFFGLTVDAGSKPTYEEKLRVPPGVYMGTDLYFYSSLVLQARD